MKLQELYEGRDWTVIALIQAINAAKEKLDDEPTIKIDSGEVSFDVPASDDIAPILKPLMKPFIMRTEYKREGPRYQYHYYFSRPLVNAEVTRAQRAVA